MKPALDVVIVNYNSTRHLLGCLHSVERHLAGRTGRVVVMDNASREDLTPVEREFEGLTLLRGRRNVGFARAVNRCLRETAAPFVLVLNPDCLLTDGSIAEALEYLRSQADIGVLGPKVLNPDGSVQGSARGFPSMMTGLFSRSSFLSRCFPNNRYVQQNVVTYRNDGRYQEDVDWVSGACMLIRREAIRRAGLFDPRFFMYWEDADLCKRMWDGGWRVYYYPRAAVVHFGGVSSRSRPMQCIFHLHRSALLYFTKHVPSSKAWLIPFAYGGLMLRMGLIMIVALLRKSPGCPEPACSPDGDGNGAHRGDR